jgi:small subunit ribosomal protein S4
LLKKTLKKINKIVYKRFLQNSNKYSNFVKLDQFFLEYFESRLDVIIFRSFFVNSLRESKKLIKNGHVLVNRIKITVNSFLIKKSDIIAFSDHCLPLLKQNINKIFSTNVSSFSPKYLEINYITFQIVLVSSVKAYNFFDISFFKLNFKKLNKYLLHI